jgi:hypothetical protein
MSHCRCTVDNSRCLSHTTATKFNISLTLDCVDTEYKSDFSEHLSIKKKLRGLSPQANYNNRATAAVGEVVPTFAGRGCYVVSATDSHGR